MASHETTAQSDEWYTPAWIFEALNIRFDLDPCNSKAGNAAAEWCSDRLPMNGLGHEWHGHVWLNPPFGGRNGIKPWLQQLVEQGDGIALVPNRTGADWWQDFAQSADGLLFIRGKIRFIDAWGHEGKSPGYGNVLMAYGREMAGALRSSAIRGVRS